MKTKIIKRIGKFIFSGIFFPNYESGKSAKIPDTVN